MRSLHYQCVCMFVQSPSVWWIHEVPRGFAKPSLCRGFKKPLVQVNVIKLQDDECISSYDVKAFFTSMPVEPTIKTMRENLEQNKEFPKEQP